MFRNFQKWKKEHSIESFGILLALCLSIVLVDFVSVKLYAGNADTAFLAENAIYSDMFITSLSGIHGNIKAFYTNEDNTKVGIVLKMENMTYLSTNAEDYQIFIKGVDVLNGTYESETYNKPSGGYYVFGTTGYSLIYLTDAKGFQNQALEVIVRNNNLMFTAENNVEADELKNKDASYAKNDQFRLIVNPAGKTATKVDFLDDLDIVKLYQTTVLIGEEDALREKLHKDIKQLNQYATQIATYRASLAQLNVAVPDLPDYINGDQFENLEDEQNTLIYKPNRIFNGGVNYAWWENTLDSGHRFLPALQGDVAASSYIDNLKLNAIGYTPVNYTNWYKTDGTMIDVSSASTRQDIVDAVNFITMYTQTLNQYASLKYQYQTVDLLAYLTFEYNLESSGKIFTSNYGEDVVTNW